MKQYITGISQVLLSQQQEDVLLSYRLGRQKGAFPYRHSVTFISPDRSKRIYLQVADQHEIVRLSAAQMDDGMVVSTGHYKVKLGVNDRGEMQFYGSRRVECGLCEIQSIGDSSVVEDSLEASDDDQQPPSRSSSTVRRLSTTSGDFKDCNGDDEDQKSNEECSF